MNNRKQIDDTSSTNIVHKVVDGFERGDTFSLDSDDDRFNI